jgi:hypothetical protein
MEFLNLPYIYDMTTTDTDIAAILKRLEVIKNVIALQDTDDINYQAGKLQKINKNTPDPSLAGDIDQILKLIEASAYGDAMHKISELLQQFSTISKWTDPEIQGLRAEIYTLSSQLSNLENELSDIDKIIHEFEVKQVEILGDIILKILALKKSLAAKKANEQPQDSEAQKEYEEFEADEQDYQGAYNETKKNPILQLTEDEEQELKSIFRKVSKLTHPDLVDKKFERQAAELFDKAKKAKDNNDINTLKQILDYLEKGTPFSLKQDTINEKVALKKEVTHLRDLIEQLKQKISSTRNSETYNTVISIPDLDKYFSENKEKLQHELERLKLLSYEPA